jgi:hypothetical protein
MQFSLPQHVEQVLKETILPDLEKGRKGYDLEHTLAVVYWMKDLLQHLDSPNLDPLVLVTAAYAHDWGYIGLFDGVEKRSIELVHKMKPLHMQRGAEMLAKLLKEKLTADFTPAQQERVAHLVRVHDLVEDLKDEDEVLLMEADTLGMLDAERITPTYSKEDNATMMKREITDRRFPRFIHDYAKEMGAVVYQRRMDFYKDK